MSPSHYFMDVVIVWCIILEYTCLQNWEVTGRVCPFWSAVFRAENSIVLFDYEALSAILSNFLQVKY